MFRLKFAMTAVSIISMKKRQKIFIAVQSIAFLPDRKLRLKKIDKMTVHFFASTIINAFVEIITHKMTKKAAFQYIKNIEEFTRYGIVHMMGINHD